MQVDCFAPNSVLDNGPTPLAQYTRGHDEECGSPEQSPQLDTLDLNLRVVTDDPRWTDEELAGDVAFRHSFWRQRRRPVFVALSKVFYSPQRAHRFLNCGAHAWVQKTTTEPTRYRVVGDRCRDRWCEACAREKRLRIAINLQERMPEGLTRFLTLTLKHNTRPLREQVERIIESFAKLRRRGKVAKCFRGGMWFLELKTSKASGLWHVHLHCLIQGDFLPKEVVSRLWHEITGDSYIVDVRSIKNVREAVGYVAKYATKAASPALAFDGERLEEVMSALDEVNTYSAFGTWRHLKLSEKPSDDAEWVYFGFLCCVRRMALRGDDVSLQVMAVLQGNRAAADAPDPDESPPF